MSSETTESYLLNSLVPMEESVGISPPPVRAPPPPPVRAPPPPPVRAPPPPPPTPAPPRASKRNRRNRKRKRQAPPDSAKTLTVS